MSCVGKGSVNLHNVLHLYLVVHFINSSAIFTADCSDLLTFNITLPTGVYEAITWNSSTRVLLYCDMLTEGGGWTVSWVYTFI